MKPDRRFFEKTAVIAGAACFLLVPYLVMLSSGTGSLAAKQSFCPFKMLTGLPCPGCGITKSVVSLYEGDLAASLQYHLFGMATVFACAIIILLMITEMVSGKTYLRQWIYNRKLAVGLGITLALYHTVRLVVYLSDHNLQSILHESIWK